MRWHISYTLCRVRCWVMYWIVKVARACGWLNEYDPLKIERVLRRLRGSNEF